MNGHVTLICVWHHTCEWENGQTELNHQNRGDHKIPVFVGICRVLRKCADFSQTIEDKM